MSPKLRKQLKAYFLAEAFLVVSMSMLGTTYILFLKQLGLSFFLIGVLNIIDIAAMLLVNVPAGVFADHYGKKKSFLVSCSLIAISLLWYYFANSFLDCAIAELLCGFGMAFYDGSLRSLMYEKLEAENKSDHVNSVFSVGKGWTTMAALFAGTAGAFIGKNNLALPFLTSVLFAVISGIVAWLTISEDNQNHGATIKRPRVLKQSYEGVKEVLAKRKLRYLVILALGPAFALQLFVKLWSPYIRPLVGSQASFSWVWAVLMLGSLAGAGINYRIKKKYPLALIVTQVIAALSLFGAAVALGLGGKLVFFFVYEAFALGPGAQPLFQTELNNNIASGRRTTTVSAVSALISVGAILGMIACGLADHYSIKAVWIFASVVILISTFINAKEQMAIKKSLRL